MVWKDNKRHVSPLPRCLVNAKKENSEQSLGQGDQDSDDIHKDILAAGRVACYKVLPVSLIHIFFAISYQFFPTS